MNDKRNAYLNPRLERSTELTLKLLFDLKKIDLTARYDDTYQSVIVCTQTLHVTRQSLSLLLLPQQTNTLRA